ncbi:MAG: hypothetical protein NC212_02185 [Staphylococcus sp.]|nr:hypothetical protein [Staphylococcus sp.]
MSVYKYILSAFLLAGTTLCESKAVANETRLESAASQNKSAVKNDKDIELISNVYLKFVFATENKGNDNPEDYFTTNALKQLQDDYEFDCDCGPCYAYYALRTTEQDSNPDSDGLSRINSVEANGNGWYTVSYSDMGWPGKTHVKITDGKIDIYKRLDQ